MSKFALLEGGLSPPEETHAPEQPYSSLENGFSTDTGLYSTAEYKQLTTISVERGRYVLEELADGIKHYRTARNLKGRNGEDLDGLWLFGEAFITEDVEKDMPRRVYTLIHEYAGHGTLERYDSRIRELTAGAVKEHPESHAVELGEYVLEQLLHDEDQRIAHYAQQGFTQREERQAA